MPAIVILFVVVAIFSSLYKNKQREEDARKKRAQQVRAAESVPTNRPQQRPASYDSTLKPTVSAERMRTPTAASATAAAAPAAYAGSMPYASSEGQGRGSMPGMTGEGRGYGGSMPSGTPVSHTMPHHAVKAVTESKHAHIESSMTGIEPDCAPSIEDEIEFVHTDTSIDAYSTVANGAELPFGLELDRDSVTRGLIMAEILEKPKALRRAR